MRTDEKLIYIDEPTFMVLLLYGFLLLIFSYSILLFLTNLLAPHIGTGIVKDQILDKPIVRLFFLFHSIIYESLTCTRFQSDRITSEWVSFNSCVPVFAASGLLVLAVLVNSVIPKTHAQTSINWINFFEVNKIKKLI